MLTYGLPDLVEATPPGLWYRKGMHLSQVSCLIYAGISEMQIDLKFNQSLAAYQFARFVC